MASKNYFRYKRGRTEIESTNDNKAAIWLAFLDRILPWIKWFAILIITHIF